MGASTNAYVVAFIFSTLVSAFAQTPPREAPPPPQPPNAFNVSVPDVDTARLTALAGI